MTCVLWLVWRFEVGDCEELTVVPVFSPVRSRVVPAGTSTLLRVMVEQEVLLLMASAAPVLPEKVQEAREVRREVPRTGSAAGAALTAVAPSRAIKPSLRLEAMIKKV